MTREEAKKALEKLFNSYDELHETTDGEYGYEEMKAIDMAIEALSQQIVAKHFDIQSGYIYCSPQIAENVKVVVRCKDCRHYIVEGITTQYGWCHEYKHSVNEDDYCSYGERENNEKGESN